MVVEYCWFYSPLEGGGQNPPGEISGLLYLEFFTYLHGLHPSPLLGLYSNFTFAVQSSLNTLCNHLHPSTLHSLCFTLLFYFFLKHSSPYNICIYLHIYVDIDIQISISTYRYVDISIYTLILLTFFLSKLLISSMRMGMFYLPLYSVNYAQHIVNV